MCVCKCAAAADVVLLFLLNAVYVTSLEWNAGENLTVFCTSCICLCMICYLQCSLVNAVTTLLPLCRY